MDFFHALEGIVTVMSIVAVGYVMTKKGVLNEENAKIIPSLVIFVSLPVYMLWNLTTAFDKESLIAQLYGLAVPFGSMLLTCLLAVVTSDILAVGSGRKGVFRTIFFCSNAVFIGIPVNLALFGEISLPYVLMYFFINTCFFWTAGNYFIAKDGAASAVKFISIQSLKKACSPPMLSVMLAVTLILSGVRFPEFLTATAKQLGGMTTPLSLIFVGIVLVSVKISDIRLTKDIIAIIIGRFIISPLSILLIASFIPIPLLMKKVFVIQSALPAMTQVTLVAKQFGADAQYAALLTAITTLLAVITIPFYMIVL